MSPSFPIFEPKKVLELVLELVRHKLYHAAAATKKFSNVGISAPVGKSRRKKIRIILESYAGTAFQEGVLFVHFLPFFVML